ncbi:MAG TPA: ice-binding family protein [Naasia sp.]|jgi:LPXTG-motif cell wall-anchored protein
MTVSPTASATNFRPVPAGLTLAAAVVLLLSVDAGAAHAAAGDDGFLGTAESYAVLAGSTATNSGALTLVTGDLGVSPGTAAPGFGIGQVTGSTDLGPTSDAAQAMLDSTAAYVGLAGLGATGTFPSGEVGNAAPVPGVYSNAAQLTGTLTLDGDADDVWVFQSPSTLITAPGSSVVLLGNANPCNVFWQVSSSATIDGGSTFVGTVLALEAISVNAGATVMGRLHAQTDAVTLIDDTITLPVCTDPADDGDGTPTDDGTSSGGSPTNGTTTTGGDGADATGVPADGAVPAATLPNTGSNPTPFLLGGGLLAVLGTAVLLAARRRTVTGA